MAVPRELEESARRAWSAAEEETAFWREHGDVYLEQFPDQFVALAKDDGRHLIAADPDLVRLVALVRERGLDMQRVRVRFMAATPISLAL